MVGLSRATVASTEIALNATAPRGGATARAASGRASGWGGHRLAVRALCVYNTCTVSSTTPQNASPKKTKHEKQKQQCWPNQCSALLGIRTQSICAYGALPRPWPVGARAAPPSSPARGSAAAMLECVCARTYPLQRRRAARTALWSRGALPPRCVVALLAAAARAAAARV